MPMKDFSHFPLACPLDGEVLTVHAEQKPYSCRCPRGHHFDVARQGYINLLPVQFKKSRDPGDSREMVDARSAFLGSGAYQPVLDVLYELIDQHVARVPSPVLLDAGCGEGWYTDGLYQRLRSENRQPVVMGLDISRWAIQAAARRSREICWMVATNSHAPVLQASVDVVFSVFGFAQQAVLAELLRPGGIFIEVSPGTEHLREIREQIYRDSRSTEPGNLQQSEENTGFSLLAHRELKFQLPISSTEMLGKLLLMTPHFFKASPARKAQLFESGLDQCSVDMHYRVFQRV